MLIREATTADVPAVAQVHLDSWDAAKEGLDLPTRRTREQRTEHWTTFLDEGGGELWVAEEHGRVVGFIAFGSSRDDDRQGEIELYTLYVDPALWGTGIGSALMGVVPSDAPVSLWVSEGNARARSFYEKRGFDPDGAAEAGHHVPVIRVARTSGSERPGYRGF